MKTKMTNKEVLDRSKQFFETVLEGTISHIDNVKGNIDQIKSMLELEAMHYQLLGKMTEVLGVLLDVCDNLEQKEQTFTIH